MELNVMELGMEELNKVSGGDTAGPEHEKIVKLTKNLIRTAKKWNRSFEDAIRLAVFAYGDEVSESEIQAFARQIYGR